MALQDLVDAVTALQQTNSALVVAATDATTAAIGSASLNELAENTGATLVGYDNGTAQDIFDNAKPIQSYISLRAYTGRASGVHITTSGIAGFFQRNDTDTTSTDNGGTIIVDSAGRRWFRLFTGPIFPKWFGAVGNGSTSDTAALQAAFNAATLLGVKVDLEGRSHNCASATLTVNCDIDGNGGTIRGYIEVGTSFRTFRNFKMVSTNSARGIYLHGLTGAHLTNITLDNVRIECDPITTLAFRLGLGTDYVDNLRIINSYIFYGIQLIGCVNYTITGCTLDGDNFQNPNELIHASFRSTGIIANNTFLNAHDNFIDIYSAGDRTIITGNRMLGCDMMLGTGIEVKVSLSDTVNNTSSALNGWDEQIVITNNVICDIKASIAGNQRVINVYYIDNRAAPVFSWANAPRNIIISGNIIDGFDPTAVVGVTTFTGIALTTLWGVNVTNNIIRNINNSTADGVASGILIDGCHDIMIHGNKAAVKDGSGIRFATTCYDITLTGNDFGIDETAGHTNQYGIYLAKIGSAAVFAGSRFTVSNNILRASLDSVRMVAAAGSITDSTFSSNIAYQQWTLQNVSRCIFSSNWVYGDRNWVMNLGDLSVVSAYNKVIGNTLVSPSSSPKSALYAVRCRASIYSGNTIHDAANGIWVIGSGVVSECDNNIIKDNISISQTGVNFPQYSSVHATDQASIVADTNIKTT